MHFLHQGLSPHNILGAETLYEVAIFPGSIRNATLNIAIKKVSIKGNYEDDFTINGEYIPASIPKIGIKPEKPVSKDLLVVY